jgi:hypothetical protein
VLCAGRTNANRPPGNKRSIYQVNLFSSAQPILGTIEKFRPDRILIECSCVCSWHSEPQKRSANGPLLLTYRGSAFPATLAFQIRELERQTSGDLQLDAIVTVVDAENFAGYEDTSPTAKMQASYTDVILIVRLLSRQS